MCVFRFAFLVNLAQTRATWKEGLSTVDWPAGMSVRGEGTAHSGHPLGRWGASKQHPSTVVQASIPALTFSNAGYMS